MTTQREFHIHIDARVMPKELQERMKELGFFEDSFTGHPGGYRHFEPVVHMTRKLYSKEEFERGFEAAEREINGTEFVGYIEGEYLRPTIQIPENTYNPHVPIPFQIERRQLRMDEPFRQTEFHLEMDGDASNQDLITRLLDTGLYGAFYPEVGYRGIVITMQGYIADILPLQGVLRQYLEEAGGVVNGILYEERALKNKLVGITPPDLPEIADKIQYT